MHSLSTSFVLGYHGCDRETGERLLLNEPFRPSENTYDWLGKGGSAINLFICDTPRLSVDLDLVSPDYALPRERTFGPNHRSAPPVGGVPEVPGLSDRYGSCDGRKRKQVDL
jgi:hypothetical protein